MHVERLIRLALIPIVVFVISSMTLGDDQKNAPCTGHVSTKQKWDIQRGQRIYVRAYFQLGESEQAIYPDKKPYDWGSAGANNVANFRVVAHDRDDHVCKIPQTPVKNLIQPSSITVNIHRNNANGPLVGSVELVTGSEPAAEREWTGSWPIPSDEADKILVFVYEGTVDDVPCPSHKPSDDEPVELTTKNVITAVKVGGKPEAYLPPTGDFEFVDPSTIITKDRYYTLPNGYSGIKVKWMLDLDKNADGDEQPDSFTQPTSVKWEGWNSIFVPEFGEETTWWGPNIDKGEADIAMLLDDDGDPAEDGGHQQVASVKVYNLRAEVTLPPDTIDGNNSGQFTVTVYPEGVIVDSYEWTWEVPQGSGNKPQVNFVTPDQKSTVVNNAHWYALPDSNLAAVTGLDCKYTINCTVTFAGSQFDDWTPHKWDVYLPSPSAATSWPIIEGMVAVDVRQVGGVNQWYVSGKGSLVRTPPMIEPHIPETSQFYKKVVTVHEGRHVTQWTSMAPWKDRFDATDLYNNLLIGMTSWVSKEDLEKKVLELIDGRNMADQYFAKLTETERDKDAYQQSNPVPPPYLEVVIP